MLGWRVLVWWICQRFCCLLSCIFALHTTVYAVCCPPSETPFLVSTLPLLTYALDYNCTDELVKAGPWCADPIWVLCDNNGYFCCRPGQTCFSNGNTDGCADPDAELGSNMQALDYIQQVSRPSSLTTQYSSQATSRSSVVTSQTSAYNRQQSQQNNTSAFRCSWG